MPTLEDRGRRKEYIHFFILNSSTWIWLRSEFVQITKEYLNLFILGWNASFWYDYSQELSLIGIILRCGFLIWELFFFIYLTK